MRIEEPKKIAAYYQALLDRKESFVGIFYVGVKTTSVFCIATCRARKPKLENVVFYTTAKEALDNGFRPCKVCKPTEPATTAPKEVVQAIRLVEENPSERITDSWLSAQAISPTLVRRWFRKHYGITFHTYQRMIRINSAYQELKKGETATNTAFDAGYESLSGFGYTYKKVVGKSPQNSKEDTVILMSRLTTPLGPMFVGATDRGICLLEFTDRRMLETEFGDLQKLLRAPIITGENQHIRQAQRELSEYFAGQRKSFDLNLDTPGTPFQKLVWDCLVAIPYGVTATYQQQAERIERPQAVRAVASANGSNRVAIVVPCHRVIGKNGKLTGYGGGIERKQWLIEHERKYAH